ncbi:protein of unknown function [Serratia sp. Tan611]|nr:protein of unknown function [Serratia sp. Tan611]
MVTVDEEDFFAGVGQKSGQIGALSGFPFTTFCGDDRNDKWARLFFARSEGFGQCMHEYARIFQFLRN